MSPAIYSYARSHTLIVHSFGQLITVPQIGETAIIKMRVFYDKDIIPASEFYETMTTAEKFTSSDVLVFRVVVQLE